ncbi:MAG TPA: prepilin-type N-terminal cleavage/methylation domain-containing protein [Desulfomonilia bacterium]
MILTCKRCCHDIKGLTMIEMMVAMALGLIVTSVVFVYYGGVNSNGAFQHEVSKLEADLNAAADMMEKDIMNAACNPSTAAPSIFSTSAILNTYSGESSIWVQADLDKNGVYSGTDERVLYRWNRSKKCIQRLNYDYTSNPQQLPRAAYSILDNVKRFYVTYYEPYHATYCPNVLPPDYGCNGALYECKMNQKLADTTYFTEGTVNNNPTSYSSRTSQYTLASSTIASRVDLVVLNIDVETSRNDPDTGKPRTLSIERWILLRNRK